MLTIQTIVVRTIVLNTSVALLSLWPSAQSADLEVEVKLWRDILNP